MRSMLTSRCLWQQIQALSTLELPKEWWPDGWFHDSNRCQPKYIRPAVSLNLALNGHPKAGNLWDGHTDRTLCQLGWVKVDNWRGVFIHEDRSLLIVYVDDFALVASQEAAFKHWKIIEKIITFKEDALPILRYLGAHYKFDELHSGNS